ncbi:MAG: acyltransferase [Paludibacteraceae bacterium]|nr:acyltransferase [Paludibacteraceae bacterium]
MGALKKIRGLIKAIRYGNVLKTIYLNLRVLPFRQAIRMPILVGKNVQLWNLHKGCIRLSYDSPKTFDIFFGFSDVINILPPKREKSMFRPSYGTVLEFRGKDVKLLSGFSIFNNGYISIGTDVLINQHCNIYCAKRITIGSHIGIGWNTQIIDSDFHLVYDINTRKIKNLFKAVTISDNVWISNGCSISKGAFIPSNSIVASGSVVNKDYSDVETVGNLFAGSPATLKKTGLVRIFNIQKEVELKHHFMKTNDDFVVMGDDFDYTKYLTRS